MTNTNIFNLAGIGSNVLLGKGGPRIKNNAGVLEIRNNADSAYSDFKAGAGEFTSNLIVGGNLTVNGTTTSVNSSTTELKDPIILLGAGTDGAPLTAPDAFDRGVNFAWYNAVTSASVTGFFGWDNATGRFVYRPDGTNLGVAQFNEVIAGNITIATDTISNASGDLTITPAGDLILSSLQTSNGLLFGDSSRKVKTASTVTWNAGTSSLTVNDLSFAGHTVTSTDDIVLTPAAGKNVVVSSLTATQVLFAGANKELSGNSTFTFNNATGLLSVSAVTTTGDVKVGGDLYTKLTATYVPFIGANGVLTQNSVFNFVTGTGTLNTTNLTASALVSAQNATVTSLTTNKLVFAGGMDGTTLTSTTGSYDSVTDTLSFKNITTAANGTLTAGNLTSGGVVYAGTGGALSTDQAAFAWNDATSTLSATNITSSGTADLATVKVSTIAANNAALVFTSGANGTLTTDATIGYVSGTGTLTTTNLTATASVTGADIYAQNISDQQVAFVSGSGGHLVGDTAFTFNSATGVLSVGATQISSGTVATTTGNLVLNPSSGVINSSTARYTNAADPIDAQDLVTKKYLDDQIGTGAKVAATPMTTAASYTQTITGTVHRIKIYVQTAYSANATMSISDGQGGTLVAVADNDAETVGAYIVDMYNTYTNATFTLSIGGAPVSGAAVWMTEYFVTAA